MRRCSRRAIATVVIAVCVMMGTSFTACSSDDAGVNTIVVWDYYGSTTPIRSAIEAYKKKHPGIEVNYQVYGYGTSQEKLSITFLSSSAPDLTAIDTTQVPTYVSQDFLSGLSEISGERLSGASTDSQCIKGSVDAMTYKSHKIILAYDFDAYVLYYREDILEARGFKVPTTWDELVEVSKAMAEDLDGDDKPDKYQMQVHPDTFQYSQFLFQNGGSIVNKPGKKVAFTSPEDVQVTEYMKKLLDNGGLLWDDSQGGSTGLLGISDECIGMFLNDPYMTDVPKNGVPNQAGKWTVAQAPFVRKPGSYLGGTGLAIPAGTKNPRKAWSLVQFIFTPKQQELVYTKAGAVPAMKAALKSAKLSQPDPFFGGQEPFEVLEKAIATATPFPYVAGWPDIGQEITRAVASAIRGRKAPKRALEDAAKKTDETLRQ